MEMCKLVFLPVPRSRGEARKIGAKFYFNRTACKRMHFAMRRSGGSNCLKCDQDKYARIRSNKDRHERFKRTVRDSWSKIKESRPDEYRRRLENNNQYLRERLLDEEFRASRDMKKRECAMRPEAKERMKVYVREYSKKKRATD